MRKVIDVKQKNNSISIEELKEELAKKDIENKKALAELASMITIQITKK